MIEPRDLLFLVGGAAMQRYGVLTRRTSPAGEAGGEVFTRAVPADFTDRYGLTKTAGVDAPRLDWKDVDGYGRKPYLMIETGETCVLPFSIGPHAIMTIHAVIERPAYADYTGDLGMTPSVWSVAGGELPSLGCYFDPLTRIINIMIVRSFWSFSSMRWPSFDAESGPGFDATDESLIASHVLPAWPAWDFSRDDAPSFDSMTALGFDRTGQLLAITMQFDAATFRARINTGAGWSAYSPVSSGGPLLGSWGIGELYAGYHVDVLNGRLWALAGARGLREPAEFGPWIGD